MASLEALVKVTANVSGTQEIDRLRGGIDKLSGGVSKAGTLLKGLAAAFAVRETAQYFKSVIDGADALRDLAQKSGIGVQALSDLKAAAEDNGLSFEGLQASLKKFSINVADAADGTGGAARAFKSLGINVKDAGGSLKSSDEILFEVSDRLKNYSDGAGKAAIAGELFGKKAGADLVPLLNQGSEAIRGLGVAMSSDFADRSDQFNDTLNAIGRGLQSVSIQGIQQLLPTLQEIANAFLDLIKTGPDMTAFFDGLAEGLRLFAVAAQASFEFFRAGVDTLVLAFEQAVDAIKTRALQLKDIFTGDFAGAEKRGEEFYARSEKRFEDYANGIAARNKKVADFSTNLLKNSLLFGEGTTDEIKERQRAATQAKAQIKPTEEAPGIPGKDTAAKEEKDIKRIEERIIKINAETAALDKNEAQKRELQELAELESSSIDKNSEAYARLRKAILDSLDAQEKQKQALKDDPWVGARQALEDYIEAANDLAAQTKSVVGSALRGLEDAFVDFFTKGKADWKDFANSIIAEITRVLIRKAIIAPVADAALGAFSFADGGVMTGSGPMPLKKYANGGIANSPQLALFGEGSRPEAYVPLPDGRRIPVAMDGQGGAGNVSVIVNVNSNGSTETQGGDEEKRQLGRMIANSVKGIIIEEKRPGGLLAAS